MDFVKQIKALAEERIKLALNEPDMRKKANRALRLKQLRLWAAATDSELREYAKYVCQKFVRRRGNLTFKQCLKEARFARQLAQKSLKNPRSW